MAKGKGEVKGWITRNGVHVPIYGNYTVRGGEEPKAKGSKFKGAGKKRKKVDTSTTSGKTANDLNSNLKKKGLELDSADLSSMAHKDFHDEKVTMYDKDGNTYEGTYNKYKNGDREIVDIKKTGGRDTGKSEVSKGHTEEGKGAVKDVKGARTTKLTEEQSAKLHSMAEEYVGSTPVSGSWDTETEHLQNRIAKEFGVSKDDAKQIMKNKLGYDDDMFKSSAKDEVVKREDKYANRDWNKEIGDARDKSFSKAAKEADAIKYDFDDPNSFSPDTEVDGERLGDIMSKKLYNEPGKNIKNNLAKIKEQNSAKNLTSEQKDKIMDIANRYNTSQPVSGSWETEPEHERQAIAKELGISSNKAKAVMKDRLGFDDSDFKNEQAPRFKHANFGKEQESSGSIPTTVSGLRSAYAEATGSEKAEIASALRRKGYSLVGGKWIKA